MSAFREAHTLDDLEGGDLDGLFAVLDWAGAAERLG